MREIELRHIPRPVQFRASDSGLGVLTGYAAVFNRYSQNLGGFVEQVDPAAFTKSLADNVPVVARFNHSDDLLLGTTEGGTLLLEIDGTGLRYDIQLPDTTAGRDVKVLAERGDLSYSSFAFRTLADDWGFTPEGFPLRTLQAVQLIDVAPVTNPAYRDTSTGLRSLASHLHIGIEQVQAAADKDELRTLLDRQTPGAHGDGERRNEEQVDNHSSIAMMRRRLDLLS